MTVNIDDKSLALNLPIGWGIGMTDIEIATIMLNEDKKKIEEILKKYDLAEVAKETASNTFSTPGR